MDVKGISLRKKRTVVARPKIGAPQQITGPVPSFVTKELPHGNSTASIPLVREKSNTTPAGGVASGDTADYVKRRYSTKITPQLKDFNVNAPPVPVIPSQYTAPAPARERDEGKKVAVDLDALQDERLDADEYVSHTLAQATEKDIHEYQNELSKLKTRTAIDLQHNIYQNRNQFIKVSQEADKLKAEMRSLRNLMSDLTNTLGQTNAALGISSETVNTRKYANRSSVANLEALWSTHLQELWRRVEGSQKFLPTVPGRRVVHESGRWTELNAATWRPRRRVHIILLNDHLLVATEKKQSETTVQDGTDPKVKQNSHVQLSADRCWPLQEVEMTDISVRQTPGGAGRRGSRPYATNAINVKVGPESFTYASSDDAEDKNNLVGKYRKALADFRKIYSETDQPLGRGGSVHRHDGSLGKGNTEDQPSSRKSTTLVDVDGKPQTVRWVENQADELDIDIALQRFDEAVARVETLQKISETNKSNTIVQTLFNGRVTEKTALLAEALIRQMTDTSSFATTTLNHAVWLTKLGFERRASEAYLDARTAVVKARATQCITRGNLQDYLTQLSYIYFTLITNTVRIFQASFAPLLSSACIKWAKEHVDDLNAILRRQMAKLEPHGDEWKACMERVMEHAGMLEEVGIDFGSLVGKGITRQ